jgi:hypothetical protein
MITEEMNRQVSLIPKPPQSSSQSANDGIGRFSGIISESAFDKREITLPLKNLYRMSECIDLQKDEGNKKCESMFCLEFDISTVLNLMAGIQESEEPIDKESLSEEEYLAASIRLID